MSNWTRASTDNAMTPIHRESRIMLWLRVDSIVYSCYGAGSLSLMRIMAQPRKQPDPVYVGPRSVWPEHLQQFIYRSLCWISEENDSPPAPHPCRHPAGAFSWWNASGRRGFSWAPPPTNVQRPQQRRFPAPRTCYSSCASVRGSEFVAAATCCFPLPGIQDLNLS